ncbi:transcriptional regulator with XRE-family HTH domain [Chitinivorax tropicus]|uniref:Transcriptional regulator with XRE-family HTH domain n=1 Tax=Chitinivorax tropicus TaxID=714531 RepID=A0A840MU63_9PROT|nr:cupin domain-containing protein [Chitinivorax tropicus]MBB5019906.1 transcriptional regulator with XRE-family HTH domain [Chitinivorax tropicus]
MSVEVAQRLRLIRERFGLSQRELAKRAGVTNSTISLIEQNRVSPSVSSLKKVLDGVPMSLAEFFTFDVDGPVRPSPFFSKEQMPNIGSDHVAFFLLGHGLKDRKITMLREVYDAHADTGHDMLKHDGQECGLVVKGRIELTVDGQVQILSEGDGFYFDSQLPHRFRNPDQEPCEIVSANSLPSF